MQNLSEIKKNPEYRMAGRRDRQRHAEMLQTLKAEHGVEAVIAIRSILEAQEQIEGLHKTFEMDSMRDRDVTIEDNEDYQREIGRLEASQAKIAQGAGIEL